MSNIVYLTVTGEQQGSISAGCGTSESTGNRWQSGHEDEIFTFSLLNNINNTGLGSQFHGITFCKLIDKSTPLFINSINNNEQLFMEFDFYRINRFGRWEKYYYIQLRGAFLSAIHHQIIENQLDTEKITISYEFILCQHLIANTEFSYLALPENYNRLFLPNSKNQTNNRFKTLNSKAIGRLLAAGGVYNGNIEGFRDTAEKLGGDAIKGYDQILNEKTAGIAIATASILLTKRSNVDTREFNSEVQHPPNQATCRSSSNTICGCLKSKHLRGLRLSRRSKADNSSGLSWLRSLPLGTYCRNKPLLFSFRPRSHALYGCAK